MPHVSKRKLIGRRKKGYSRSWNQKNKGISDHTCAPLSDSTDIVREDSVAEKLGWDIAWKNFILEDNGEVTTNINNQNTEEKDSDNFSADEFYVVLHWIFQYYPRNDLDYIVKRIKTERLYRSYLDLRAEIGVTPTLGDFTYAGTDDHGVRFIQLYQHNSVASLKMCLTIGWKMKLKLQVHDREVTSDHPLWTDLPQMYKIDYFQPLLSKLESRDICVGNYEHEYVVMVSREIPIHGAPSSAYREDISAERGKLTYDSTIRSTKCSLLVSKDISRCHHCDLYRHALRRAAFKQKQLNESTDILMKTPNKNLSKEQLLKKIDIMRNLMR